MTFETFAGLYNYWIVIFLMMTGFYIVIARENLIKTIIGLNIFQTSVFLLYVTMGKVTNGEAPIIQNPVKESHGDSHGVEPHGPGLHKAVEHADHAQAIMGTGNAPVETTANSPAVLDHLLDEIQLENSLGQVQTVGFEEDLAHQAGETLAHGPVFIYSNPLPSVLMLTAIVVGIATTALALALVVRIREEYGTIEEDEILELDRNS
ncbi:MAG: multicomponent Na+:H+ antiporter subunit C [Mariniblastus sp.]